MKKSRTLASLVAFSLLLGASSTAFANATWYSNTYIKNTFDNFVSNKSIGTGAEDNSAVDVTYLVKPKDAGEYTAVTGMFGKAADDKSLKFENNTTNNSDNGVYFRGKQGPALSTTDGVHGAFNGEYVNMQWKWAFEDFNVDRCLEAKFYEDNCTGWNETYTFAHDEENKRAQLPYILKVCANGNIVFFGEKLAKPYFLKTNKWYDFQIIVKAGVGMGDIGKSYCAGISETIYNVAYLYVDGALIAEKNITDSPNLSRIFRLNGLYTERFTSYSTLYDGVGTSDVYYLDDFYAGIYKPGSADAYCDMNNMADGNAYPVTFSGEGIATDGIHLSAIDKNMTVAEFVDALHASTTGTALKGWTYVDAAGEEVADTSRPVQDGDQIKYVLAREVKNADTGEYSFETHYRKIVDGLTYMRATFEGRDLGWQDSGLNTTVRAGAWWGVNSYGPAPAGPVKEGLACEEIKTTNYMSGADPYIYYSLDAKPAGDYVVEMSALRKANDEGYGETKLVFDGFNNTMTVLSILSDYVAVATDTSIESFYEGVNTNNKWYKIAIEVDATANTAKIYLNGIYTGVTRELSSATGGLTGRFGLLVAAVDEGSSGSSCIDDVKVYDGKYMGVGIVPGFEGSALVADAKKGILAYEGDLVSGDIYEIAGEAPTFYDLYTDDTLSDYPDDEDEIPTGAIVVFYDEAQGICEYYRVCGSAQIGDIVFENAEGKLNATVTITNRSSVLLENNVSLIIASYDADGTLKSADVCAIDGDLELGENVLTTSIDYEVGDTVKAYLWHNTLNPILDCVPYVAK